MTAGLLLGTGLPLFDQLFPPMPLIEQVQNTPLLITAVLMFCLAAAFLALWRTAPDFRAFRTLGIFFAMVAVSQSSDYFGGQTLYWCLRALASGMLVEAAGEAMQIPRRRWTLLFWPIYLFVSVAVWFPNLSFTADWPMLVSAVLLAILIFQGLRRRSARDRMIAAAFLFYWCVRLTLTGFFQVLPIKSDSGAGGVLVIIGDVSGKGMPAAMTVSLLVGTVRTLAHYTQRPGEILAAMNQRMLARSHGGFTTCLALRADADGTLTIANAGHIAPYIDGKEPPLENGLPLGISADTIYAESTFQLSPKQQLTLLTDGVIEARDKAGALFGFERSASLSTQPADAIAQAAQAFGQDDDITVLSVTRTGGLNPATA